MIELDTIKELFKQSIDESDNMSEAVQRLFDKVYDKGKEKVQNTAFYPMCKEIAESAYIQGYNDCAEFAKNIILNETKAKQI